MSADLKTARETLIYAVGLWKGARHARISRARYDTTPGLRKFWVQAARDANREIVQRLRHLRALP